MRFRSAAVVLVAISIGGATVTTASKLKGIPNDDRTITHVLNRIGFGPAPGDVQRVAQLGLDKYIEQQLHPEKLPDDGVKAKLASFETLKLSSEQIANRYYTPFQQARKEIKKEEGQKAQTQTQAQQQTDPNMAANGTQADAAKNPFAPIDQKELQDLPPEEREKFIELRKAQARVHDELTQQKLLRAVYSDHQLEEQLVDFWFNHFNVFVGKGPERVYLTEYERDVIRPHVFGKFRDLLGATAHSPAMMFYLDNWMSADPNGVHVETPRARIVRGPFGRPMLVQPPLAAVARRNPNAPKGL